MSQISRDEVAHLAKLARLALNDAELDGYAAQLDAILTHVSTIQGVDVTGVAPTGNPLPEVNVMRPDTIRMGLRQRQALDGAPQAREGRFVVPQILGDDQ